MPRIVSGPVFSPHLLPEIRRCSIGLTCALAVVCTVGCGSAGQPWEKVVPASGSVSLSGKPIAGAQITLFPVDQAFPAHIRPSAVTDAGGKFSLGTNSTSDGAPAGDYTAVVTWNPLVDKGGGPTRGPNQLPAKYAQPESSGLKVTIGPEATQIPSLDLK